MGQGKLVLVVGPSGAGKDSLLNAAGLALANDDRFIFAKRLVTRPPQADAEDHDYLSWDDFKTRKAQGDFTLIWEAHGHGYIIPKSIDDAISTGKIAVCNASRHNVPDAARLYPDLIVIVVDADKAIRAKRLLNRGRETEQEITARLAREAIELPPHIRQHVVDNSGLLQTGIDNFIATLKQLTDPKIGT